MLTSRRKIAVAWIALLAVLYTAATPVLAALRFEGQPDVLARICTMEGVKTAPQPAAPSGQSSAHEQLCVFCIGGAWQPPVQSAASHAAPGDYGSIAALRGEDARPNLFAVLQPVSPRAPPAA